MLDTPAPVIKSPWLTIPQAAMYLQMDLQPFREAVYGGVIPSYKRSKHRTFLYAPDLDMLMLSYEPGAKAKLIPSSGTREEMIWPSVRLAHEYSTSLS